MKKSYIKPILRTVVCVPLTLLSGSPKAQVNKFDNQLSREADNDRFTEDTDETWDWE